VNRYEIKKGSRGRIPAGESGKGFNWLVNLLTRGDADVIVADASSIPLRISPKVEIAAIPARGNPFDVLISMEELILDDQPEKASFAVIDHVRQGQLLYYRPDLSFVMEKGGFDDLQKKMESGSVNGFVIGASEVEALNHQDKVVEVFTASICMPVAGQGGIGLLTRQGDTDVQTLLQAINDPASAAEFLIERSFLGTVTKDGKGPVGVLGSVEENEFRVEAAIASPDGQEKVAGTMMGGNGEEERVVEKLAEELLAAGGRKILSSYKRSGEAC
jgi:hydroxymethylbilane synthase